MVRRTTPIASVLLVLGTISLVGTTQKCSADDLPEKKFIHPRSFGFDIDQEPTEITPGKGQRVTTTTESGAGAVGLVHVELGTGKIVLLPDGQLVARSNVDVEATDRPFDAIDKDDLAEQLHTQFPGFKTKQTRRYLYVYSTSDEFALATSRILETMYPGMVNYAEAQQIEVQTPATPMVVVMFRREREFQAHKRMPEGVVAYYEPVSNRVVMYEEPTRPAANRDLAIQQALSTIAHEGAHQILHNIGVQQRLSLWPMWLSEGLAEYYAPTSAGKRLKWKGAGQVNDVRMFELEQYIKARTADTPNGQMIEHTVSAARLTSTGYASAWSLTHYLAKMKRKEFNSYVKAMSELQPLETYGSVKDFGSKVSSGTNPENLVIFKKYFGDDHADLERRLVLHLKKQPYVDPFANYPHVVGMLIYSNGRRTLREANVFHSRQLAEQWGRETTKKLPAHQQPTARFSMKVVNNRPIAVRFVTQWLRGG